LTVASGSSTTITFINSDTAITHDFGIGSLGRTDICAGPCTRTLTFTAPAPGSYVFNCSVHPDMVGTLIVR
jgi:plastocyanin